jgi:hypothetical protein
MSLVCNTSTQCNKKKGAKGWDHLVPWEFKDAFPKEVLGLPPKRYLDFSIYCVPIEVPTSKLPHKMSMLKLVELKVKLKEMMDKGYIGPSVSLWGALALFVKKKDGTL